MVNKNLVSELYGYYFGILLKEILERLEVEYNEETKNELHSILKAHLNVKSISRSDKFTDQKLRDYIFEIRVLFTVEFGWVLKEPGEPDNIEQMELGEFLKLKL